jgi:hypothetical protein
MLFQHNMEASVAHTPTISNLNLTTHPILHASVLDSCSLIRRHNPRIDTWPDMGRIDTIPKWLEAPYQAFLLAIPDTISRAQSP